MLVLAGDVGGTKTLLMLAEVCETKLEIHKTYYYASTDFNDMESMVHEFLQQARPTAPVTAACLAVAGPVSKTKDGDTAQLTNLPWSLHSKVLAKNLNLEHLILVNDFVAIAYALNALTSAQLHTLQSGHPDTGSRLILGAGTGLGICMIPSTTPLHVLATEGGHAGFAPNNLQQQELWTHIQTQEGHCTREHLLSGSGLLRMAQFLCTQTVKKSSTDECAYMQDLTPAKLTTDALTGESALACKTLELFIDIYGSIAGDLALSCLPSGGVYIAGGIAPRIISLLEEDNRFIKAFQNKPPMTHLLKQIPVHVITDTHVGLMGAAYLAAANTLNVSTSSSPNRH